MGYIRIYISYYICLYLYLYVYTHTHVIVTSLKPQIDEHGIEKNYSNIKQLFFHCEHYETAWW